MRVAPAPSLFVGVKPAQLDLAHDLTKLPRLRDQRNLGAPVQYFLYSALEGAIHLANIKCRSVFKVKHGKAAAWKEVPRLSMRNIVFDLSRRGAACHILPSPVVITHKRKDVLVWFQTPGITTQSTC